MASLLCIDVSRIPITSDGLLHATNNQFQKAGPKGFIQVKVLENDNLYVRVDLPGVPDDAARYRVDAVRQKIVFFSGESVRDKDGGVREYSGTAGLGCNCCEITDVDAKMKDGVLRMILSRVKVNKDEQNNKCTLTLPPFTGHSGTDVEDHPYVVKGRKGALSTGSVDGSFYFGVDIPGVSKDEVQVLTHESYIRFLAEVKNVYEHDESPRVYGGRIHKPPFSGLPSDWGHTISWEAEFGVLSILLTPRPNTTTTKNNNAA